MDCRKLIEFLGIIEKLKCNTRHSWTSSGRRESVAEHTFRLAVMAMLCRDEYPTLDAERSELSALFAELKEMKSDEARLCVSLDKLETLISHNEADLSTWLPREYEENLVYGKELCAWSEWTARMHEAVTADSIAKIARESK